MTELFDIAPSLSPRLKWMQEHGITVIDNGPGIQPGDEDEGWWPLYRFCAHNNNPPTKLFYSHLTGWGDTEDAAIVDFATKQGIRLWNEPEALTPPR